MAKLLKNALFSGVSGILLYILSDQLFDFLINAVRCFLAGRRTNNVGCFTYFMLRLCDGIFIHIQKISPFSCAGKSTYE